MKINKELKKVKFESQCGGFMEVQYTNMGEPFREGIQVCLESEKTINLFIEQTEAKQLRDLLNSLYPP